MSKYYLEEKCGFCKEKLLSFLPTMENEGVKYCCLECLDDSLEQLLNKQIIE